MTFMARREPQIFYTRFQEWLSKTMDRRGVNLKWVATETGLNYENLWKVARGNPERYPSRTRLDYHNTKLVGAALDDETGALAAAGYESGGLPEIERMPDETILAQIESYDGENETLRGFKGFLKARAESHEVPPPDDAGAM